MPPISPPPPGDGVGDVLFASLLSFIVGVLVAVAAGRIRRREQARSDVAVAVAELGTIGDDVRAGDPESLGHGARRWRETRSQLELATFGLSDRHRLSRDVNKAVEAWDWCIDSAFKHVALGAEPSGPPTLQELLQSLSHGVPLEKPATADDIERARHEATNAATAAETWRRELEHRIRPGRLRRTVVSLWWRVRRRLSR